MYGSGRVRRAGPDPLSFVRRAALGAALGALALLHGAAGRAQTHSEFQGITVFEAEAFDTNHSPRSGHSWELTTATAAYSGTGAMVTTPNTGTNLDTSFEATSPELQYSVGFTGSGTRYVWVRGYGASGADDSVHAGLNGVSTTAARMTVTALNQWQWTNAVFSSATPASISVPGTGTHTFSLWMREDGMVVDRIVLTTNANFNARTGNCWHIPNNAEPGIASMRLPFDGMQPTQAVTIYNGNQFQGPGGDPGNQLVTGSTLYYRDSTWTTWTTTAMAFHSESGNNKYFSAQIPANTFAAGTIVEYYLRIPYDTHLPSFLFGSDSQTSRTELEAVARAAPYRYQVSQPLTPSGPTLSHADEGFEARIYTESGHIEFAQPALDGSPLGIVIPFQPPRARIGGTLLDLGPVVSHTPTANGLNLVQQIAGTTVTSFLGLPETGVMTYEVTDWNGLSPTAGVFRFASSPTERFYGFGEKFNSVDQSGRVFDMLAFDQPGDKGDFAYKPMPWFLSTRGFGFHLAGTSVSTFDMRGTNSTRCTITDPRDAVKFHVVGGPRLPDALSRYTAQINARPPLPPEWAFGPWFSTDVWRTGGEVRYAVTRLVQLGIPTSVLVFDSPWETSYNDFTWNMVQFGAGGTYESQFYEGFASHDEMMEFLRAHGLKIMLWMTPFVNTSSNNENIPGQNLGQSANYAEGAANGYFVRSSPGGPPLVVPWWKGQGSPVDFTNPAAAQWLKDQLQALVDASKVPLAGGGLEPVIGGFKTDDGETGNGPNTYIPLHASYSDGRTGVMMRNGYCVEYHATVQTVLGTSGVLFARSGYTGTQAIPVVWAGDNAPNFGAENGLLSVIVSGQTAAMSGYSMWSHDIGGYQDGNQSINPDDLFRRWAQFGALTPVMQMHRQVGAGKQFPWAYSASALDNYRKCAELHSELFPYIYTAAKRSADTGLPIIAPPVLYHQEDANTHNLLHTYYFGEDLIVAPVNAVNATSRNVYLPAGTWYNWWTNQPVTGGQVVNWSDADVTRFPLYVRDGAIVPLLMNIPQTMCSADYVSTGSVSTPDSGLRLRVWPSDGEDVTLYDGTRVSVAADAAATTMTLESAPRAVEFAVTAGRPLEVKLGATAVTEAASEAAYLSASTAWYEDTGSGRIRVKFDHTASEELVRLLYLPEPSGVRDWGEY